MWKRVWLWQIVEYVTKKHNLPTSLDIYELNYT